MSDRPTLSVEEKDGKTIAQTADLENWDKNPRKADDVELERLEEEIEELGFYKPLIVDQYGTVLGGNMRLRALESLGEDHVWVSVVECETDDDRLEYALSDNDRVGYYDEDGMAALISDTEVDVSRFKIDFYKPTDLAQNLASSVDPEDLLKRADDAEGDSGVAADNQAQNDTDGDSDDDSDSEPKKRSMENLGNKSSTAMVQLFMSGDEKETLAEQVQSLKKEYGLETTSDVVQEAVRREFNRHDPDRAVVTSTGADKLTPDGGEDE